MTPRIDVMVRQLTASGSIGVAVSGGTRYEAACPIDGCAGALVFPRGVDEAYCEDCGIDIAILADALSGDLTRSFQRLDRVCLSSVEPRRVKWCWDGRLVDSALNLLAGPEGLGKSTFLAWLAAAVSRGTLPGEHFGIPRSVLIAALEDDVARTLVPRMIAVGANLNLIDSIPSAGGTALALPGHLAAIEAACNESAEGIPVGLIILDPIKATTGAADTNKESDVRALLGPLLDFAQRLGVTVLASAHFKKGARDEDYAAWKVSGTPAWTQVPRSVLFFGEDPDADEDDTEARVLAHANCNVGRMMPTLECRVVEAIVQTVDGPSPTGLLVMGGESSIRAADMGKTQTTPSKTTDAVSFLSARLGDGEEHEYAAIVLDAESEDISSSTLDRAAKRLKVVKQRHGTGTNHRSTWSLPPDPGGSGGSGGSAYPSTPALPPLTPGDTGPGGSGRPPTLTRVTPPTRVTPHDQRWRDRSEGTSPLPHRPGLRGGCANPGEHAVMAHPWGHGRYCPICAPMPSEVTA